MCVECDNPKPHRPHMDDSGYEFSELTIDQRRTLETLKPTWENVTVYDSGPNKLVIASKGSEYSLRLIAPDGHQERITDPLNESHWFRDVLAGRWNVVR